MQITLTQKDFPFPYNCSDVWKQNKVFKQTFTGVTVPYNILHEEAYNCTLQYILKHDEGGIAHAIYNLNDVINHINEMHFELKPQMSIDQVRELLFSMVLITIDNNKFAEYKKLFNDAQTVQECCQVYYDIVGIQCFMTDGSVIRKQPLI